MCKCDPTVKTPWCGKPGCEMPEQVSEIVNPQKKARVEITIGKSSRDSSITLDGVDISSIVQHINVECGTQDLSTVTLRLVPAVAVLKLDKQLLREQLRVVNIETSVESTPISGEIRTRQPGDGCTCGYLAELQTRK